MPETIVTPNFIVARIQSSQYISSIIKENAVAAFEANGFLVLVDNKQAEDLDEKIELGAETSVSFVKLVPLVGG